MFFTCTAGLLTRADAAVSQAYRPLDHLWTGTRDLPDHQNLIVFSAGTAATLGAFALDNSVTRFFEGHQRMGAWSKVGNDYLGTGVPGVVIGLGTLVYGLAASRAYEISAGESHLEALLANFAYTSLLKYSVRRHRPGGSDNRLSFPSGHASTVFTSASNLLDLYGPVAGVTGIVLGAFTGVSRLDANAHHLSDVIFGATLGMIVGHAYAIHHAQAPSGTPGTTVAVRPYFESRRDLGVALDLAF